MTRPIGTCPKCKIHNLRLTRHHIYVRQFFGRGNQNNETIDLCWECHRLLHMEIPNTYQLPREMYKEILEKFLRQ